MIRRFNYTGRKQITKEHAKVALKNTDDKRTYFEIELELGSYNFPREADVRVEAWRSNAVQRWNFGTVGNPTELSQEQRTLQNVPHTAQFKVVVVAPDNSGLLFGKSNAIRPIQPGESAKSLLPVRSCSTLGQEVWKLDFGNDDQVELQINDKIENIDQVVAQDPSFRSLAMPEIFRSVLRHAILVDNAVLDDDDDKWDQWIALAHHYLGSKESPELSSVSTAEDVDDALEWVDNVAQAFASSHKIKAVDTYSAALSK